MADVAPPEMRANGVGTEIGTNDGGDPFTELNWRMQPCSRARTRPRAYGNVVTLGLEGEARIHD
jgi:hypothetical protein